MQMPTWSWKSKVRPTRQVLWNLALITVGSWLCAVAINGILIPHQFFGTGFTGASLVIHYLAPSLPIAVLYFILNVPLFALGWMYVGRRFFLHGLLFCFIFTFQFVYLQELESIEVHPVAHRQIHWPTLWS